MKYQVYFGIAIRIIILFGVGFMWTFLMPYIKPILGDHPCPTEHCGFDGGHVSWGAAHYWYFWGMFLLFLLSLINCIIGVVNLLDKHYKL